jgi:hypothetical protein
MPSSDVSSDTPSSETPPRAPSDAELVRDAVIFNIKLWVDGFKDVVLVPLSIAATGLDLVLRTTPRGRLFYRVMDLGTRFERWLNLYDEDELVDSIRRERRADWTTLRNGQADASQQETPAGSSSSQQTRS